MYVFYGAPSFITLLSTALPLVPILSHINLVHALQFNFFQIHINILLPLMPRSSKLSLSIRFLHLYVLKFSPHACHKACLSRPPWFDHQMGFGEKHKSWSSPLRSFLQSPVISYLSGPNISLSPQFSNNPGLCSSLNVQDQVSHLHETRGKRKFCIYFVSE
jgi:hypothetical protein